MDQVLAPESRCYGDSLRGSILWRRRLPRVTAHLPATAPRGRAPRSALPAMAANAGQIGPARFRASSQAVYPRQMRIDRIAAYALPFRFAGGGYRTSYGTRTHLNTLLLVLETDRGLTGYGEVARLNGAAPEPTDPDRVRLLSGRMPKLLGADPGAPQAVRGLLGELEQVSIL